MRWDSGSKSRVLPTPSYARCGRPDSRVSVHHSPSNWGCGSSFARDFPPLGRYNRVFLLYADKRGHTMTITGNSPDATHAHSTGARNSAHPILDEFDAIAA